MFNNRNVEKIYFLDTGILMSVFVFIILTVVGGYNLYQLAYGYIGESTETVLGEKIGINAEGQEVVITDDEYKYNVDKCLEMKQSGYLKIDNDTNTADINCNTFVLKKEGFIKIVEYLKSGGSLIN
jgi:hypothetical protein